MHCSELASKIDDYVDGQLTERESRALDDHADDCTTCRQLVGERTRMRQLLAELPVEGPSEEFFANALNRATQRHRRSDRRPWFARAGGAAAAVLAFVVMTGIAMQASVFSSGSSIPEVTITMHEVTPVNLQFASAIELENAQISLQLPEGVAIAGYAGRKELRWRTSLREGNNLLQLPLIGYVASSDRLVAELDHPQGKKHFELQITVNGVNE